MVLPEAVAKLLGLPGAGKVGVRDADHRRVSRPLVRDAWVQIKERASVFTAVLEPKRTEALIGAFVMEELDLVADCVTHSLQPRDPKQIIAEIE
jgi:hypothetical protein